MKKNIDIDDEERLDLVRMRALITNMYECFQIRFLEIIKGLIWQMFSFYEVLSKSF